MRYIATTSDADIYSDDDYIPDQELINDLISETGTPPDDPGYTQQLSDISSLLLFCIFALGVLGGFMFSVIMWRRIK